MTPKPPVSPPLAHIFAFEDRAAAAWVEDWLVRTVLGDPPRPHTPEALEVLVEASRFVSIEERDHGVSLVTFRSHNLLLPDVKLPLTEEQTDFVRSVLRRVRP